MHPFDLDVLLGPYLVIALSTLWVAYKVTGSPVLALFASLFKAGMFLFYFGVLFNGTFTFLDDWTYLEGGADLYAQGVGVTNLAEYWEFALTIGGGDHFAYYLYNTYAFQVFGQGYYAPVAMNILLTVLLAWLGTGLAAQEFKLDEVSQRWFFAMLLLHPDILAWSNFINGKDVLILLMNVLLLVSCSLLFRGRFWAAIALAVPVSLLLLFMRFYVPLLFTVALFISLLLRRSGKEQLRVLFLSGALLVLAVTWIGSDGLAHPLESLRQHFVNPFYGAVRFVLTPIPFNTETEYGFLDMPALIHWLLFPFACWGVVVVRRLRTPFSSFFLMYVLVFVSLYAVYGELQGPRHRVQLDYAWAIFQFMGVMAFLRFLLTQHQQALIPNSAATPALGDGV